MLPVATPFQQRTVDENVLKKKVKTLAAKQPCIAKLPLDGSCFRQSFFSSIYGFETRKSPQISYPLQPRCCGETNQSLPTTRAKEGQMPRSTVQVLRQYRTCRWKILSCFREVCKIHAAQNNTSPFRQFTQPPTILKPAVSLAYPKVAHLHSPWQWLLSPMTATPKPPR